MKSFLFAAVGATTLCTLSPPVGQQLRADDRPRHPQILSTVFEQIPDATSGRPTSAIYCHGSVYVAGEAWNKKDGSTLWLWRVSETGEKQWGITLHQPASKSGAHVVGILPGARKFRHGPVVPGVRVYFSDGVSGCIK